MKSLIGKHVSITMREFRLVWRDKEPMIRITKGEVAEVDGGLVRLVGCESFEEPSFGNFYADEVVINMNSPHFMRLTVNETHSYR